MLVAALSYPEADYDFAAYHMGGVVKDLEIRNLSPGGAAAAVIRVRDEDISFSLNPRRDEWIFPDFDRISGSSRRRPVRRKPRTTCSATRPARRSCIGWFYSHRARARTA